MSRPLSEDYCAEETAMLRAAGVADGLPDPMPTPCIGIAYGAVTPQPMLCINSAAEADAAYLAGKIDDDMRAACVRWFTRNEVRQVTLVKVVGEVEP